MKKRFLRFFIGFVVIACVLFISRKSIMKEPNLNFEYLYSGFYVFDLHEQINSKELFIENTDLIFTDLSSWQSFRDKYYPDLSSIPYVKYSTRRLEDIDFNKYCLLFSQRLGAKPTYAAASKVKKIDMLDNELIVVYEEIGDNFYVIAQNTKNVVHTYVSILLIPRDQIPSNVNNIYIK